MRELEEAGEKEKELKDEELDKIYGEFNPDYPRFREMLDDGIFYILTDWNVGILWRS